MAKKKKKIALPRLLMQTKQTTYKMPVFKIKRVLSEHEEFEIMKLVLDKFLWLGTALFGWGLYVAITSAFESALYFILSGIVFLFLFSWIVVNEFEQRR